MMERQGGVQSPDDREATAEQRSELRVPNGSSTWYSSEVELNQPDVLLRVGFLISLIAGCSDGPCQVEIEAGLRLVAGRDALLVGPSWERVSPHDAVERHHHRIVFQASANARLAVRERRVGCEE